MKPPITPSNFLACILGIGVSLPCIAQDAQRGQQMFDTHCIACHSKSMFIRAKPIVNNPSELVQQVQRWQRVAGQEWSSSEINDVVGYLNDRFYKFPIPKE